jgi:5-methylcytosine-specific restriction endonuclease McrBC regulatory subunit McrC
VALEIYGILFDGAWLWEEYISSLICEKFHHPMNKGHKGAQRLFDGNKGLIYPDFISKAQENRVIADAKYKPNDNIGNRDYLQVLAYMFRFDTKTGYYLYPEANNHSELKLKLKLNSGSTYENNVSPRENVSVIKYGIIIHVDAENYEEFVLGMKGSEEELKNEFDFLK